ncbi:hypothetical protein GCM10010440_39870 [Kitasatospora cinereorecta]
MLVLVGSSSTSKTRACWQAVQPLATAGWRLWHPYDPTRPGLRPRSPPCKASCPARSPRPSAPCPPSQTMRRSGSWGQAATAVVDDSLSHGAPLERFLYPDSEGLMGGRWSAADFVVPCSVPRRPPERVRWSAQYSDLPELE